jgi:tetratricopeptide (TPR) repeat protein
MRSPLSHILTFSSLALMFLTPFIGFGQNVNTNSTGTPDYYQLKAECRDALYRKDYRNAEHDCTSALAAADRFPELDFMQRVEVLELLGATFIAERDFANALPLYKRRFDLLTAHLNPNDEQVGIATRDLAEGYQALGQPDKAEPLYKRALLIMEFQVRVTKNTLLKNRAKAELRTVQQGYASLLRRMGRTSEANELESKYSAK